MSDDRNRESERNSKVYRVKDNRTLKEIETEMISNKNHGPHVFESFYLGKTL